MNNKITYKDFFKLTEQSTSKPDPTKDVVLSPTDAKDPKKVQAAQAILKTTKGRMHIEEEAELDEAQLLNRITDYKGGVEYVLFDPATATNVADEIKQFAAKKNIDIIKFKMSTSGKVGYFLFKLGEDAAKESQQIQGYISQKPEIKHFRFNVRMKQQTTNPEI